MSRSITSPARDHENPGARGTGRVQFGLRIAIPLGSDFGLGGSFLGLSAHNLLQVERKGATRFGADKGQAKERNAGHSFLKNTRDEAAEAGGLLAGFGDDLIASQDVDIVGLEQMLANEEPEESCPRSTVAKWLRINADRRTYLSAG